MEQMSTHGVMSSDVTDNKKKNKRVIFEETGSTGNSKKQKLLESDEEDEEYKFPDDSELASKSRTKLSKLQSNVGNDERFTLDERFVEEEDLEEEKEEIETEFSEERKQQLEILGDVLGKPISTKSREKNEKNEAFKSSGGMIRYDPTEEKHQEYEILPQQSEKVKKQKKKKKEAEKVENSQPPPVSNEIFHSVSDKLALGEGEQFSLFKTLGKDPTEPDTEKLEIPYKCEKKRKRIGSDFETKKSFKYDSSDDEETIAKFPTEVASKKSKSEPTDSSVSDKNSDRFFFIVDDPRFEECKEFFGNRSERSEDLKTLRPILKQTIRKRIRTNLKKNSLLHKRKPKQQKY